jgi:hypothetical protein
MTRNMTRLMATLAVVWLHGGSGARAETVKFRQGVDGYTGTQDVELRGGKVPVDAFAKEPASREAPAPKRPAAAPAKPSQAPKPADRSISVDLDNGGQQSQALIRFNDTIGNGPGKVPAGATVAAATLTFYATSAGGAHVFVHRVLSDWDPEKITWDTAKLAGNIDGGIQVDDKEAAAPFTAIDSTRNGQVEIDVLPVVKLWVAGAQKNFGLALTCDSANGWDFESSKAEIVERRPLLTITYTRPAAP